ncbi:head decoration protein [Deefgea piscis]|uniref:head decoration protein n=1 Tax=Deefgea piscis TaxID=2739061 RepID=UPI001C825040|nr:head decoration protein [Deefgea piscis]QZA80242.1 head decoration protein [Deefgea piscis]
MFAQNKTEGVFTPDNLMAGSEDDVVVVKRTIASGQNLKRGAVIGKITASGKFMLSASASSDGSQVPDAILQQDVDASGGDKEALIYLRGDFNASALTLGVGHSVASIFDGLRAKSIFIL